MFSLQIKHILIFLVFFLIGVGGIIFYISRTSQRRAEVRKTIAAKSAFSLENAPKESIRGDIISYSGYIKWESRVATEPGRLIPTAKIQQGEILVTQNSGSIKVNFPTLGEMYLMSNTEVALIQSLPTSFVVTQSNGNTIYTSEQTTPISVRSLHLLANVKGKATISTDAENGLITIRVAQGDVTIAYNAIDNISQVELVSKGETLTFNDETREATIE